MSAVKHTEINQKENKQKSVLDLKGWVFTKDGNSRLSILCCNVHCEHSQTPKELTYFNWRAIATCCSPDLYKICWRGIIIALGDIAVRV